MGGGGGLVQLGGGQRFECKQIEGGGAKLQCKQMEGGKISVHRHLKAISGQQ